MLWKCFKIEHWDIRSALGQSAKQALLSKPCFPLTTRPGRVWLGVDVPVYAISPSRKLKCTCPTLSQHNRATGMWSYEEGSSKSSGHWFPFHGLSPPRQTNSPQAAMVSWQLLRMFCSPQTGQHSRFGSIQSLLTPKCTCVYGTNSPDTRDLCELRDADAWEPYRPPSLFLGCFFPLPNPLSLCLSPVSCSLPPDPHHERHFLIFSHSPTSCISLHHCSYELQCVNANFDISGLLWIHAPLFLNLSSNSASGNSCPLFFLFSYLLRDYLSHLTHHLTGRPRSWLPCHPALRFPALILRRTKKKRPGGESLSCCNTWSLSACMNKNCTPLSFELKLIRMLDKHPARLWEIRSCSSVFDIQAAIGSSSSACTVQVWDVLTSPHWQYFGIIPGWQRRSVTQLMAPDLFHWGPLQQYQTRTIIEYFNLEGPIRIQFLHHPRTT